MDRCWHFWWVRWRHSRFWLTVASSRDDYNWVGLLVFVGGFIMAWSWWSFSVPRWRVWAYERVSDIPRLKETAVAVGLTWPDGHRFERTELKSEALRVREESLDPARRKPQ
jgi:hypothetical protein